jgi:hypothetical protein
VVGGNDNAEAHPVSGEDVQLTGLTGISVAATSPREDLPVPSARLRNSPEKLYIGESQAYEGVTHFDLGP